MLNKTRYIIALLFLSSFFGCYTPQKGKVVKIVSEVLKEKKPIFLQIIDTFQNIKNHSKDWQLENMVKSGIGYVSFDTTTDTYISDFAIPSNFKNQIKAISVSAVRIIKDSSNNTTQIDFTFNSDIFPPITRYVILTYFPHNIPDSLKDVRDRNLTNWTDVIDKNWLLSSVGHE